MGIGDFQSACPCLLSGCYIWMCSVLGAGNPDTAAEERAGCAPREIRSS